MYADLYNMCLNVEGVMNMFSKELQILDQNTVKYMIDEMQEELDTAKAELTTANATISEQSKVIADNEELIAKLQAELKKYQH
jgi:predicted  nucleic acid-binding Zn-ribbon protein